MTSRNERSQRAAPAAARLVAAVAVAWASAAVGDTVRTDTPEATVQSLHAGLVAVAEEQGGAALDERYRALEPLVEATHDLPYIAEFAIRRQWRDLDDDERARFVAAFTRLSVTTYASRFAGVGEASFRLEGSEALPQERAEVRTAIARADGTEVPLEYTLQQREDGGWKIINIVADGVSDLALKRAEYQRVLASGSIEDLIRHIDAQTAQLR